jgi:hypothetical protein
MIKSTMKLSLNQYPAAIAHAAQKVNLIEQQLSEVRLHLNRLEGNADLTTAFDQDLKNEYQRKARRFEILQANAEYERGTQVLTHLTADKANAIGHLEYLRNEFGLAKLQIRQEIVQKLTGYEEEAELAGLL